tara:strand:+ start:413 stop:829 length:417 start_codon:yes stop_codon:yes gene_type:complete
MVDFIAENCYILQMKNKIRELFKLENIHFVIIAVLFVAVLWQSTHISGLKDARDQLADENDQLRIDAEAQQQIIAELNDEAHIYLDTLSDMKAYNADLERKVTALNNDVQTAEFMINDLEQELMAINERLQAHEADNQ